MLPRSHVDEEGEISYLESACPDHEELLDVDQELAQMSQLQIYL